MARATTTKEEAKAPTQPEPENGEQKQDQATESVTGVVFINNFTNRQFNVSKTRKYKFKDSRENITDPELIEYFTGLAKAGTHRIFIEPTPGTGNDQ